MKRRFALLLVALCLVTSAVAHAAIDVDAHWVFGANSAPGYGWSELVVRIENDEARPRRGTIELEVERTFSRQPELLVRAPFSVGPGSAAIVQLPVRGLGLPVNQKVRAIDEDGSTIDSETVPFASRGGHLLVDLIPGSKLSAALQNVTVAAVYEDGSGSSSPQPLVVGQPRWNSTTGDPILPLRPASYASAAAVVIASDQLVKLTGPELEALTGYVLGGGNLAIVVRRPEDLRHDTLQKLVGGEVVTTAVPPQVFRPYEPAPSPGGLEPMPFRPLPDEDDPPPPDEDDPFETPEARPLTPSTKLAKTLVGYRGGKLHPSPFGATARYGVGEVHLLAFDPTHPDAIDDPWAQSRIRELAGRGLDLRTRNVFTAGPTAYGPMLTEVHRQLDPNQTTRFAIVIAGIALLIYAVIAGPVNFSLAAKKGRPLRALAILPLLSAGTFTAIVIVGFFAKGSQGRARHLTLIEAGAGDERAAAHRFRGFYVASGTDLDVRGTDAASLVYRAPQDGDDARQTLVVERDGVRLTEMTTLPWETLLVREDGFASLGSGIAVLARENGDAAIVNRTGRDLRGVVVNLPGRATTYFPRIRDGETVLASDGRPESLWSLPATMPGARGFDITALRSLLERDVRGLGEAWMAIRNAAGRELDWFPSDVPVVLAQLDGGEGTTSDSGLALESDRALVRVIGWGGAP